MATTLFTAVVVSALAGVARLDEIAALANAGTLAAFTAVGICLVVLRLREPNRERTFRTPLAFVVGPLAAAEGTALEFGLVAADPDGDILTFSIAALPAGDYVVALGVGTSAGGTDLIVVVTGYYLAGDQPNTTAVT